MSAKTKAPNYPILDNIEVPEKVFENWQITVDMLANIAKVPAALIMRVHPEEIEVFVSSQSAGNVYHHGETAPLNYGLYCETVMNTRRELYVSNALKDPLWDKNPDIQLGMISYCGLPLTWPEGEIFGTICILDNQEDPFSQLTRDLLERFRDSVQFSLKIIYDTSAERKRAENTLRESEALLFNAFNNSPLMMTISDLSTGKYLEVNDSFCITSGFNREDIIGRTSIELGWISEGERTRMIQELQQNGKIHDLELILRSKSGKAVICRYSGDIIQNSQGNKLFSTAEDITEHKRAEQTLRLHTERVLVLLKLNQMTDATLNQLTNYALEEAVRITQSQIGYLAFLNEDETVLTMHSWSKQAMNECAIINKPIQYLVAETGLWGEAVRQRKPVITNDYAAPNPAKKGHPQGHVSMSRHMNIPVFVDQHIVLVAGVGNKEGDYDNSDVEQLTLLMEGMWHLIERKQAEEALRIKNYVFDVSIAANSIADLSGVITEANEAFVRCWGFSGKDEVVGKPLMHFIYDPNMAVAIVTALNSTGQWEGDYSAKKKDGSTFIAHGLATTVKDEQGKVIGYQSAVVDVTEQREAQRELKKHRDRLEQLVAERTTQLESTNKELLAFSYSVSHDLRAPLRGIDGWSLALLEDYGSQLDGQAKTYLEQVRSEAQHMGQLIDNLLQLSHLTNTEMRINKVNLSAMAMTIAAHLQEAQPERQVEFIIHPGVNANGDSRLLEIALTNLLDNAFKFTGKTPQARIKFGQTELEGQRVFFVGDNGAGFDLSLANKLFGAFQRMHTASDFPGTGIGLTTVQRIVHRHGGRIWAEATVNQGATFYFTLEEIP